MRRALASALMSKCSVLCQVPQIFWTPKLLAEQQRVLASQCRHQCTSSLLRQHQQWLQLPKLPLSSKRTSQVVCEPGLYLICSYGHSEFLSALKPVTFVDMTEASYFCQHERWNWAAYGHL